MPERMRDHWWWRPGWRVGRRKYAVHTTFEGQDELHRMVAAYQEPLRRLPGLDLVPVEWLHLTMQDVGFTDEVEDVDAVVEAVRRRLRRTGPVRLTFERPVVDPEAPQFFPQPVSGIDRVRRAVRQGVAEVRGEAEGADTWWPHMSIAYSNSDGPAEPCRRALANVDAEPVTITVRHAHLIVLSRDDHLYRWDSVAHLDLGPP